MVGICAQPRRCSATSSKVRPVRAIICGRIRRMTEPRETKNSSQAVGFSRTITGRHPGNDLTTTTTNGRNKSSAIHIAIYRSPHREWAVPLRDLATPALPLSTSLQVSLARGPARADRRPYRRATRPPGGFLRTTCSSARRRKLPLGAAQAGPEFIQAFPQSVADDFRCVGGRLGCKLGHIAGVLNRDVECLFRKTPSASREPPWDLPWA